MGTIGLKITNPMDLLKYKSVYVKAWERPCAVSFLISMQFRVLASFISRGIYEYTPAPKKTKTFVEIIKEPIQSTW
jgi:hypothetical protein